MAGAGIRNKTIDKVVLPFVWLPDPVPLVPSSDIRPACPFYIYIYIYTHTHTHRYSNKNIIAFVHFKGAYKLYLIFAA